MNLFSDDGYGKDIKMNPCSSYESFKLIIEGKPFICDKNVLVNHSEYFKHILGPNKFKEAGTKELEVKDIEYNIMEIVLTLTYDSSYVIGEENILMVLEVADMLLFPNVLELCIKQATELISVHSCLKIWLMTEHIISTYGCVPIYLKAKTFALQEFDALKATTYLMELNLNQLCSYLANAQLHCAKEIDVFQVFMRWWYDNCANNDKILPDATDNFVCMLFCLDFNALSLPDIKEMLAYPDINENSSVLDYLNCLMLLKNAESTQSYPEEVVKVAQDLMMSKRRTRRSEPYLIMDIVKLTSKKSKKGIKSFCFIAKSEDSQGCVRNIYNDKSEMPKSISYYNIENEAIEHFLVLPSNKTNLLEGFQLIGYKEFIFFFGGERAIGRGLWNLDFLVYDTIRETWFRKTTLPNCRRHFQSCIIDSKVFMVGGTGAYRVIQNDMLFYDFKSDIWSKFIELPNNSGCLKCCNFLGQLLLVDCAVRVSYLFNEKTLNFVKVLFQIKSLPFKYSLYTIDDKLCIKGVELLVFKLFNGSFVLHETFPIESQYLLRCDQMNSILCSNYLFTIYKDGSSIMIEKFDIISKQTSFIPNYIYDIDTDETYHLNCGKFKFRYTDLFAFSRFELFERDCYVNNFNKYIGLQSNNLNLRKKD